jgi:hypothetical protein
MIVQGLRVAVLLLAVPTLSFAQQPLRDRWPTDAQQQQMQSGFGAQKPAPAASGQGTKGPGASGAVATTSVPRRAEPPRVVVCSGVFGKDSSHLKLAQMFEAQNITYGEVDGPQGTKIMASILYPKDPKRRLEVLWQNEAARTDLSVISINGQSTWVAPKGLKLGVPLDALEKLNGKPFKLSGFDWDDGGAVRDWMDGGMTKLPGGCNIGMKLAPDPRTSAEVRGRVAGDKDFMSSDPLVRAAKPIVEEITIGYPQ